MPTLTEIIAAAIKARQVLAFEYDGKPRVVEPHAVGVTPKGATVLRAFQTGGDSATSDHAWKLFNLDKIVDVTATNVIFFQPRDGYKMGDRAMATILAQLDEAA